MASRNPGTRAASVPGSRQGWLSCRCAGFAWLRKERKAAAVEDYDIHKLTADIVGLIDALGDKTSILIGYDWGAGIAWNSLLLHPERYTALVAMSVPYSGRPKSSPTATLTKAQGDNFYYTLYFQEPGR